MNAIKLPKQLMFIPTSIFTGVLFLCFIILFDYNPDTNVSLLNPKLLLTGGIIIAIHMISNYPLYRSFLKKVESIPAFIASSLSSYFILFVLIQITVLIDILTI